MKQILLITLVAGGLVVGCGKEEDELPPPSSSAPVNATDPVSAGGASVAGATTTQTPEPFDPSKVGPPPPPTVDFGDNGARPVGNLGEQLNDLELLNHILFTYNEGRGTYSTDYIPNFKSDAERLAYDEALRKLKEPITDLNELVRLKVIKSIPAAPAGKKYAVNKKTLKVELVDATAQP